MTEGNFDMKIVGFSLEHLETAVSTGRRFNVDFPARMGSRQGVGYRWHGVKMYAYRTKSYTVVRYCGVDA